MARCYIAFRAAEADVVQRFPGPEGPGAALKLSHRHGIKQYRSHSGRHVRHTGAQARSPPSVDGMSSYLPLDGLLCYDRTDQAEAPEKEPQ